MDGRELPTGEAIRGKAYRASMSAEAWDRLWHHTSPLDTVPSELPEPAASFTRRTQGRRTGVIGGMRSVLGLVADVVRTAWRR